MRKQRHRSEITFPSQSVDTRDGSSVPPPKLFRLSKLAHRVGGLLTEVTQLGRTLMEFSIFNKDVTVSTYQRRERPP